MKIPHTWQLKLWKPRESSTSNEQRQLLCCQDVRFHQFLLNALKKYLVMGLNSYSVGTIKFDLFIVLSYVNRCAAMTKADLKFYMQYQ